MFRKIYAVATMLAVLLQISLCKAVDESVIVIDSNIDTTLDTDLHAADGQTLTLVKKGNGKLTIPPGKLSGKVTVDIRKGAVLATDTSVLLAPPTEGRLFWLDATKYDSMTIVDGKVSEWRDAGGNGYKFTQFIAGAEGDLAERIYEYPSYVSTAINNMPSVRFDNAIGCRLVGSGDCATKTLFVVSRAQSGMVAYAGLYGRAFLDEYGLRTYDGSRWMATSGNAHAFDANQFYVNGTAWNDQYPTMSLGAAQILAAVKSNVVKYTPAIGGYTKGSEDKLNRNFNGDVAEVIAYDRIMEATERERIENYLSKKWKNTTYHVISTTFPAVGSIVLSAGAKLDLRGAEESVSGLSGVGEIVSTSGTAALTVTGDATGNMFTGDEVTINVAGTAHLAPYNGYNALPSTEHLLWWLDANAPSTITTNANGQVMQWASRVGSEVFTADQNPPWYAVPGHEKAMEDGKPGIWFDNTQSGRTRLISTSTALMAKTLFLVVRPAAPSDWAGFIGRVDNDCGIRYWNNSSANPKIQCFGNASMFDKSKDTIRFDGVGKSDWDTNGTVSFPNDNAVHLMAFRVGADHTLTPWCYGLGNYCPSGKDGRSLVGWFCETIAYDSVLTDDEIAVVEDYLTAKWKRNGSIPPDNESVGNVSVARGATLFVSTGSYATLASSAGTVNGDVILANPFVVTADSATGAVSCPMVNGAATIASGTALIVENAVRLAKGWTPIISATTLNGAFVAISTDDPNPSHVSRYQFKCDGTRVQVGRFGGLFVIIR